MSLRNLLIIKVSTATTFYTYMLLRIDTLFISVPSVPFMFHYFSPYKNGQKCKQRIEHPQYNCTQSGVASVKHMNTPEPI